MKLLDRIAKHPDVPPNLKVPWGSAILSAKSQSTALHKFGTRGTLMQMQNKEAIVSSAIALDTNNNILNKPLLRKMTPHKSYHGSVDFIEKCKGHRVEFDHGRTNILCSVPRHTRDSYVHTLSNAHSPLRRTTHLATHLATHHRHPHIPGSV